MIPVDSRPRPIPRRDRTGGDPDDEVRGNTPFGPYRASHSLAAIVEEIGSPELTRRLARHLSDFLFALNQLEHLPSDRFRKWMVERFSVTYRQQLVEAEVARATGRERDAWTHLICVLAAHARERVRQINCDLHEAWLEATRERRAAASRRDRR